MTPTDDDLPPVIYTYTASTITDCDGHEHCHITRGNIVYAYVSTNTLTRVTYCEEHWTEQAHN